MPLTLEPTVFGGDAFAAALSDAPSYSLTLQGGESLFAALPDAGDSSFSSNSWSAEDHALDNRFGMVNMPTETSMFHTDYTATEPGTESSDEQHLTFEDAESVAVTPMYDVDLPVVPQQQQQQQQQHDDGVATPLAKSDSSSYTAAEYADNYEQDTDDSDAAIDEDDVEDDEPMTTTRPTRRKAAAAAASTSKAGRKSKRVKIVARPNRTAAKLAAIKSKTTRAAQSKLKRKAASISLSKSELELAGTLELSRDELLNMTSDALEVYAQRLAAQRPLTVEEQKRFKRQRRLIKNRESAQLSRLRKKAYVDELEKQIAELEEEKERVNRRVTQQQREIDSMRNELEQFRDVIATNPNLAAAFSKASAGGRRARV